MTCRMKCGERREAIVSAAVRLFAEKGFRGATTRELATAVGVTEPVLYQHFRTKRELYDAIVESKAREGNASLEAALGPHIQGRDDWLFFTRLAELILERHERDPEFVRLLLFSALERHELAELFYERQVMALYDMVIRYVKRRMREGAFRRMDARVAARAYLGMISHHALVQVLFGERILKTGRKPLIAAMVGTFLEG
ncbi:MAG: TetR/AcrR family transcriptional regulator, partial [Bryobacterales bacterium]|nr:TetR/AcrR family transcriptional regulator [Bryobacterales bacterium]